MKKQKKSREIYVKVGLIVKVMKGDVLLRSHVFNDEYTAEIFCRMVGSRKKI